MGDKEQHAIEMTELKSSKNLANYHNLYSIIIYIVMLNTD